VRADFDFNLRHGRDLDQRRRIDGKPELEPVREETRTFTIVADKREGSCRCVVTGAPAGDMVSLPKSGKQK
jgi:hypothetical protein